MKLTLHPLTPERFAALETLFNARGCSVARGCWCMCYRQSGRSVCPDPGTPASRHNRSRFKALVDAGEPTGLIGYRGVTPMGWVSVAPRAQYAKLARSPVMKPVDDAPVWSIVCFVVPQAHRGQGVATALLLGTVAWAKRKGIALLEAYPVDKCERSNDEDLWFGKLSMFSRAGFEEVARRKTTRPVVRLRPV